MTESWEAGGLKENKEIKTDKFFLDEIRAPFVKSILAHFPLVSITRVRLFLTATKALSEMSSGDVLR